MVFLNANAQASTSAGLSGLILPIAILAIFYFMAIRPQKKRENEITDMRNSLKIGDKVVTIGGIQGKIVKLKDDNLTIEVGADRTKIELTRWAVGSVTNRDIKEDNKNKKSQDKSTEKTDETSSDDEKED